MDTVLFLTDAKLSEYKGKIGAQVGYKTIVNTNPDIPEATALLRYAKTAKLEFHQHIGGIIGANGVRRQYDVNEITERYTVQSIRERCNGGNGLDQGQLEWVGYLITHITGLDIDSPDTQVCFPKCTNCKQTVNHDTGRCKCVVVSPDAIVYEYRIPINVTDATGTLMRCFVYDDVAKELLQLEPTEFVKLNMRQRTNMKTNILFEKFKVYFRCHPKTSNKSGYAVSIIAIHKPSDKDIVAACNNTKSMLRNMHAAVQGV